MTILETTVPVGIGDLIYLKSMLDFSKHKFNQIKISFHRGLVTDFRNNDPKYHSLLDEIGQLFFSESPYIITNEAKNFRDIMRIASDYGISLKKPELGHLLCKGDNLNLGEPYIVLTTKIRYLSKSIFNNLSGNFWNIINSSKYKIVILGERIVEMNPEYIHHTSEHIYSIYDDIINNISCDKLIDLSIPALGITSPNLKQIQQDCLIMKDAKFVVTFGVGGNFCMATAVANTIGYRADQYNLFDYLYDKEYPNAMITKDWNRFIETIKQYI